MKRKSFSFRRLSFAFGLTISLTLLFSKNKGLAQCTFSCTNIQVSLDQNCESLIIPDFLVEGDTDSLCVLTLSVEIYDGNALIPTSPVITGDYIDQTLTGRVVDPLGNYCEGTIAVEDKLKPTIQCMDTVLTCFDSTTVSSLPLPIVEDNCTPDPGLFHVDNVSTANCTTSDTIRTINRLWTATDNSGNQQSCIQMIYVVRPGINDIQFPVDMDDVSAPPLYCPSSNTDPMITGWPHYNGTPVDSLCSFVSDYTDVIVPTCEGSFTLFREWELFDGCASQTMVHTQIIHVVDTLAPQLVCPGDVTVSTSNLDCTATVVLPTPFTYDSCGASIAITVEGVFGIINGTTIYNLPSGLYDATCRATDDCGNVSSCLFQIEVQDDVPPVAVSVGNSNVTLLPAEPTYVNAATFDDGSWDNCSGIQIMARRMDATTCNGDVSSPYDTIVPFYCCDAGNMVDVELMVMDGEGNMSTSMTSAEVYDNLNPGILCPNPITLDCEADYEDLNITGQPIATDNCPGYTVSHLDSVDINNCGIGTVMRTFTVEDVFERTASCTQTITLEATMPFYVNPSDPTDPNDDIVWPQDYTAMTCGEGLHPDILPAQFSYPEILADSTCSLIATSYDDTELVITSGACVEIIRTWLIIDWCQFNPLTQEGLWEYVQVLQVFESDAPEFTSICLDTTLCGFAADCQNETISLLATATDDCTPADGLEFSYTVDIFNDDSIDDTGDGNLMEGSFPFGTHSVEFAVDDGCGNITYCSHLFAVEDCKNPTPVCESVIVEIQDLPDPYIEIFANSFDAGSYDNCTDALDLNFSFTGDSLQSSQIFTCADLGLQDVEIWVIDENGNQDFCVVELELQNNNNACEDDASIAGAILRTDSSALMDVQVFINSAGDLDSMLTDAQGIYNFEELPIGGDYSITPASNNDLLLGVTTFDIVLITKHILGVAPLDSPYKHIAADVNNSSSITTLDIVYMRRAILLIDAAFPNNDSYRFIDRNYVFDDPNNPLGEPFPEAVSINNLSGDEMADFIAVKIGDVN